MIGHIVVNAKWILKSMLARLCEERQCCGHGNQCFRPRVPGKKLCHKHSAVPGEPGSRDVDAAAIMYRARVAAGACVHASCYRDATRGTRCERHWQILQKYREKHAKRAKSHDASRGTDADPSREVRDMHDRGVLEGRDAGSVAVRVPQDGSQGTFVSAETQPCEGAERDETCGGALRREEVQQ